MKLAEQRGDRGLVTGARVGQQRDEIAFVDHDRFTGSTIAISAYVMSDLSRPSHQRPCISPHCVSRLAQLLLVQHRPRWRALTLPPHPQEKNICARQ
jgi:hypothetical protein